MYGSAGVVFLASPLILIAVALVVIAAALGGFYLGARRR
jgi:hypothetical protein